MKRIMLITLALLLIVCMNTAALAVPKSVQYRSTREFLAELDKEDINYTYEGISSTDDEIVTVGYTLDNGSADLRFFFSEDEVHCSIRVWNLIDFDRSNIQAMYKVCNGLNETYKYCCFYVDSSDYSVTVSMDLILPQENCGDIMFEALLRCIKICDDAMPTLNPYSK